MKASSPSESIQVFDTRNKSGTPLGSGDKGGNRSLGSSTRANICDSSGVRHVMRVARRFRPPANICNLFEVEMPIYRIKGSLAHGGYICGLLRDTHPGGMADEARGRSGDPGFEAARRIPTPEGSQIILRDGLSMLNLLLKPLRCREPGGVGRGVLDLGLRLGGPP